MKRLISISMAIVGLALAFVTTAAVAPTAYADHCEGLGTEESIRKCEASHANRTNKCPNGVETAYFGCVNENRQSTNLEDNPIFKLLLEIMKFLGYGVGIVVVGGISYGAFLIATSNANAGQTQQGITIIVNAFIGLLLYIFLFAIANFIVPGGIFT